MSDPRHAHFAHAIRLFKPAVLDHDVERFERDAVFVEAIVGGGQHEAVPRGTQGLQRSDREDTGFGMIENFPE